MVLKPEKEKEAEEIFKKWGLDFAIVGKTTDTSRFIVRYHGDVMVDLPINELGDQAPEYDRPFAEPKKLPVLDAASVPARNRAHVSNWTCKSRASTIASRQFSFWHTSTSGLKRFSWLASRSFGYLPDSCTCTTPPSTRNFSRYGSMVEVCPTSGAWRVRNTAYDSC